VIKIGERKREEIISVFFDPGSLCGKCQYLGIDPYIHCTGGHTVTRSKTSCGGYDDYMRGAS